MSCPPVALDAGWLRSLDDRANDDFFERIDFLRHLADQGIPILFDTDGQILAEYERVLLARSFGRRFFTNHMRKGLFLYGPSRPRARCAAAIRASRFDPADVPYVAVAASARGVFLTHEPKHRENPWLSVLRDTCHIPAGELRDLQHLFHAWDAALSTIPR